MAHTRRSVPWYHLLLISICFCLASTEEPNYYIIGLFSTCSSEESRNSTNSSILLDQRFYERAFQTFLAFERTSAYYNQFYLKPYNVTAATISIDVCASQDLLVSAFLDLFLDDNLFEREATPSKREVPKYLVIYSFMTEHLTWLAKKIFQVEDNKIPFVILNTKDNKTEYKEELWGDLLNLERIHQVGTEYQIAYKTKIFFEYLEWKSIVILILSQSEIYQRRAQLFYDALREDQSYCVYRIDDLNMQEKLQRTIKLIQERTDLQIIYAMGNIEVSHLYFPSVFQITSR